MHKFDDDDKKLSPAETLIMKAIWDAGEDIPMLKLLEVLEYTYKKKYARTTVETFMLRLMAKDFVRTYKIGKNSYVHALKTEDEYKKKLLQDNLNFWYGGKLTDMMTALCEENGVSEAQAQQIKELIDGLDQ